MKKFNLNKNQTKIMQFNLKMLQRQKTVSQDSKHYLNPE